MTDTNEDYKPVDLNWAIECADSIMGLGGFSRREGVMIESLVVELRHHRAVEAAMGPRSGRLCKECGKGYVASEGCLRCKTGKLEEFVLRNCDPFDMTIEDRLVYGHLHKKHNPENYPTAKETT